MQMINEVTVMQANKNIFNKVLAELKKSKSEAPKVEFTKLITMSVYGIQMNFVFVYDMGKIYTIQESDTVFFCAEIMPRLVGCQGVGSGDDPVLKTLHSLVGKIGNTGWDFIRKDLESALVSCGLSISSTEQDLKNCSVYKELSDDLDKFKDVGFSLYLVEGVQKKLKTRKNIIPLMFYKIDTGEFNYPYKRTPYNNLNATSCRTTVERDRLAGSDMHNMCLQTMRYVPYKQWTVLSADRPNPWLYYIKG